MGSTQIGFYMEVAEHTIVSIRYRMRNRAGDILEDNLHGPSIAYMHGEGVFLPSLENELQGLKPGDAKELTGSEGGMDYRIWVLVEHVRKATEEELRAGFFKQIQDESCGPGCRC